MKAGISKFAILACLAFLTTSCFMLKQREPKQPTYQLQPIFRPPEAILDPSCLIPFAFRMPELVDEPWFLICRSELLADIARTVARIQIVWPGQSATNYFPLGFIFPSGPWVKSVSPQLFTSQDTVEIQLKLCSGPEPEENPEKLDHSNQEGN